MIQVTHKWQRISSSIAASDRIVASQDARVGWKSCITQTDNQ
jgi:hypothetical protein